MLSTTWLAGVTGLEPAASGVTGRRSNQLSYTPSGEDIGAFVARFSLRATPKIQQKTSRNEKKNKKQALRPVITFGREHSAN